jgi:hypothetical protein
VSLADIKNGVEAFSGIGVKPPVELMLAKLGDEGYTALK